MAKFRDIVKGAQARKRHPLDMLDGSTVEVDVTIILGDVHAECLASAADYTKRKGGEPRETDPVYDFALACEIVARGIVDPDSPMDAPEPFFANADEVRLALDPDRIALLAELQQTHQDECSPRPMSMSVEEYAGAVVSHAMADEGQALPFEQWRPVLRRHFVRSMASQLQSLLKLKWLTGSSSESSVKSDSLDS